MQKPIRPKDLDPREPYPELPDIYPAFADEYRKVDSDYVDRVATLLSEGHPDDLPAQVADMRKEGGEEHQILSAILSRVIDWYHFGN